jgi:hypothetical protein
MTWRFMTWRFMTWRDRLRVFIGRRGRRGTAANARRYPPVANHLVASPPVTNLFVGSSLVGSLLVCSLLAGCSTDGPGALLIDPGRYSVYHCDGLVTRLKALLAREQELSSLMERASEGGGGALIGNLTYRTDYEKVLSEEKLLRRTAAEKKCELPPPAVPASPTQAVYTAPPPPAAYSAPPPAGAPVFQSDQTIH